MIYGSVCSGIEAATVAWHPLGWKPAWFCEFEKFPSAVLAHHYPDVPNMGDMTKIDERPEYHDRPIDLLVGGTPCQSFSIAGLRKGLDDDRGNLALKFCRILADRKPRWFVWENVPGVLSSNGGRDFAAILSGFQECGYGFAYRILDAQYFGVAQRRRRVFVVGHLGDWRPAAAVLFERQSLYWNPPPRREKEKTVAARASSRTGIGSHWDGKGYPHPSLSQSAQGSGGIGQSNQELFSQRGAGLVLGQAGHLIPSSWPAEIAPTLNAYFGEKQGLEDQHVNQGCPLFVNHEITHTLRGQGYYASEDGTGRGTPLCVHGTQDPDVAVDRAHTLGRNSGQENAVVYPILEATRRQGNSTNDPRYALNTGGANGSAVRRLTPRECERLQGFPDDYTNVPSPRHRRPGKRKLHEWQEEHRRDAADGPRYKALGNSMAVPVMRWIGERIQMMEELHER